jgi:hypothetical protein
MDAGIFRLDEPFLRQIAALSNEKMVKYRRKIPSPKWRLIVSRYLILRNEILIPFLTTIAALAGTHLLYFLCILLKPLPILL